MVKENLTIDSPQLKEIPKTLWADSKYDVGLMKGVESVTITPKTTHRPRREQYPLKPEAERGIKPVFQSLVKAGIIIPCENSPDRTPIFPVKKIRDKGQREEWRFVQDLQAVNAEVQLYIRELQMFQIGKNGSARFLRCATLCHRPVSLSLWLLLQAE